MTEETSIPQTTEIPILVWKQTYSIDDTIIPIFFFHPSLAFLEKLQKNPPLYTHVPIEIEGTDGLYDGFHFGTVDQTTSTVSSICKPTNYPVYTITLPSISFTMYPSSNGFFRLL